MFVRNFRGVPQTLQIFKKFYHIQEVKIYTQKRTISFTYTFLWKIIILFFFNIFLSFLLICMCDSIFDMVIFNFLANDPPFQRDGSIRPDDFRNP